MEKYENDLISMWTAYHSIEPAIIRWVYASGGDDKEAGVKALDKISALASEMKEIADRLKTLNGPEGCIPEGH